jgi:hypothetical protein
MKNYLKSAVDRFKNSKGKEEYLINPVSEVDAEIIIEIIEAFKKLGRTDISSILDGWKYHKDKVIQEYMMQWNIDNPLQADDQENSDKNQHIPSIFDIKPRPVIKIRDEMIDIGYVHHYNKIEEWVEKERMGMYGIILNETPSEAKRVPIYANKKIFFYNVEERDEVYDKVNTAYLEQDDIRLIE